MKRLSKLTLLSLLICFPFQVLNANPQIVEPVEWQFHINYQEEGEAELVFKADIDEGWHVYAMDKIEGEGPIPTSFTIQDGAGYELLGDVAPKKEPVTKLDQTFEKELSYFENQAVFIQKVSFSDPSAIIKGSLEYMTCDDSRCLPPTTEEFTFEPDQSQMALSTKEDASSDGQSFNPGSQANVKSSGSSQGNEMVDPISWKFESKPADNENLKIIMKASLDEGWHLYGQEVPEDGPVATNFTFSQNDSVTYEGNVQATSSSVHKYDSTFQMELTYFDNEAVFAQEVQLNEAVQAIKGSVRFMVCDDSRCLPPDNKEFNVPISDALLNKVETQGGTTNDTLGAKEEEESKTFWGIFIAGLAGGLLALLTPCVFPMIPLTVSFFTKQSEKAKGLSQAFLYGISIVVIYIAVGFIVTKALGADAMNAMASSGFWNMLFFIIFAFFAASFFGAFELSVPNSWVNKMDAQSDRGGLIGIFFMAFTLALVSFSCTGPIIGTLLVQAAVAGSNIGPLIGMLGFSLALAVPFTIFAAFPSWLNTLPQSGGWLNSVKVVLGFLELALALKFLSNVDLVYQWEVITREVFIGIWITIFTLMGFYLLGKLKFAHDTDLPYISVPRLFMAIVSFAFVVYLIPGLFGAPLKMISGFPPPMFYREWKTQQPSDQAIAQKSDENSKSASSHSDKACPHGLNCFHDYEAGLEHAKKVNKPIMIDFTGWTCVNCRKMEDNVWINDRVFELISNEYVLVSLYVDDKTVLPEHEQYISEFSGDKIETVGNKWSDFQATKYGANSQPYYVLLDHEENVMVEPRGYTPDVQKYINFLEKGLKRFEKGQEQTADRNQKLSH